MSAERWGPYCPLPQDHSRYVQEVYPVARGLIQDADGVVRKMTAEEIEQLEEQLAPALDNSFILSE